MLKMHEKYSSKFKTVYMREILEITRYNIKTDAMKFNNITLHTKKKNIL